MIGREWDTGDVVGLPELSKLVILNTCEWVLKGELSSGNHKAEQTKKGNYSLHVSTALPSQRRRLKILSSWAPVPKITLLLQVRRFSTVRASSFIEGP